MRRLRPIPVSATAGFSRHRQSPRTGLGWGPVALALALIVLATAATVTIDTSGGDAGVHTEAQADARAFLRTYVAANGRVVRRDQGGDTVSEGQAYGLLLAEVADQPQTFARIWRWTASHLQQANGELRSHMSPDGTVVDTNPASDADLLAAWALSQATGTSAAETSEYRAQAHQIADSILANETVDRGGQLFLTAGPWATGEPASLDPSYWAAPAFAALARFTGDPRFTQLADAATRATQKLTDDGALLPPDWAKLTGATAAAEPAPNHQAPQIRYGLDAQRLVVWMAVSCDATDRALAARWWTVLSRQGNTGAIALTQQGDVIDGQTNALSPVAAAAGAHAAGNDSAANMLLAQARHTQHTYPTYYGGAWLALGEALLSGQLGGCAAPSSGGAQ